MKTWFFNTQKVEQKKDSGNFISLASHELRSPLSIIKWYTEMLLDEDAGPLTEDQRKYITTIETSNQRAIDLVRSLLNVSRLESQSFSITPEPASFPEILDECITPLKESISKKQMTLSQEVEPNLPSVMVDRHLVMLILKQLLSNAIAFSKEGGMISVAINLVKPSTYHNENLRDTSIVIAVADQGIGIPEKDRSKIFSKMFRASNVSESNGNGPGLGLFIAKTIVDYIGGRLWFNSSEGGSAFYVAFPIHGMKIKEGKTVLD